MRTWVTLELLVAGAGSFLVAAAVTLAVLGEEAPRAPVVVVIDCGEEEDSCSAALSAAAVSAGDADME